MEVPKQLEKHCFKKGHSPWNKKNLDEKKIIELYHTIQPSKIAKRFNCGRNLIYKIIKKNNSNIKPMGFFNIGKTPWNKGKKLHYDVWNKGIPQSEETKRKQKDTMKELIKKGKYNPIKNFGKYAQIVYKQTEEHKRKSGKAKKSHICYKNKERGRKISETLNRGFKEGKYKVLRGKDHPMYGKPKSKKTRKKMSISKLKLIREGKFNPLKNKNIKPNKPESFHNPLRNKKLVWHKTLPGREEIFKKYGWKSVILWEKDIYKGEEHIVNKLGAIV